VFTYVKIEHKINIVELHHQLSLIQIEEYGDDVSDKI